MNAEHRQNLLTLATYLMEGRSPNVFDMRCHFKTIESCGTVACAAGHGPDATGEKKAWLESWSDYLRRVFGLGHGHNIEESRWCFACQWADVDNTSRGAGQRILWLVRRVLPDDWTEQLDGIAPLCYVHETLEPVSVAREVKTTSSQPLTAGRPA